MIHASFPSRFARVYGNGSSHGATLRRVVKGNIGPVVRRIVDIVGVGVV